MEKLIIKQNNKGNIFIDNCEFPELDYKQIEENAYFIAKKRIVAIIKKLSIGKEYINAIEKSMLHIYEYFYKHSKLISVINVFSNKKKIYVKSNYIEKGDIDNIEFEYYNNYHFQYILILKLLKYILRGILWSFNKSKYKTDIYFKCHSMEVFRLFKFYFPNINLNNTIIIIDVPLYLPRVKTFIDYLNKNGIKYINTYCFNIFHFIKNIPQILKAIFRIKNYREYIFLYKYIEILFAENKYNTLMNNTKGLKVFIASDEYNYYSDIINKICNERGIDFVNFQHGGIYLADHNYQKFIVMGDWVKKYYCNKTKSIKDNIYVLGNPCLQQKTEFNKNNNKKLKILLMGQYLLNYVTYKRKENIVKAFIELKDICYCELFFKDHPASTDNIMDKFNKNGDINIIAQDLSIDYKLFDITFSFYSTTLIESILNGVPSVSLNFDNIKGIYLLENSKVLQINSKKQLYEFVKNINDNRNLLKELWYNEYENIKGYWNTNDNDRKRFYDYFKGIL